MLTIRLDSPIPLGQQIRLGIREAIARGDLQANSPLPPVRQLANDLGINFNTVARAYRELEQEGLVITVRGRGTMIVSTNETRSGPKKRVKQQLARGFSKFLSDASLAGLDREEIEELIRTQMETFWTDGGERR